MAIAAAVAITPPATPLEIHTDSRSATHMMLHAAAPSPSRALIQPRSVVHLRIPSALSSQSGEKSHEQLVAECSDVAVAAVGDVSALLLLRLGEREGCPSQHLQDVLHFLRRLHWPVRDCIDVADQLFGCYRFVLLSEETSWSSWDDSAPVHDPKGHIGWRGHSRCPPFDRDVVVSRGC